MYAESQPPSEAHSHAHVADAIGSLSKQDCARLRVSAHIYVRDLCLDTVAADADDLVSEAVIRTTSGQRVWKVGVSLLKHLRGVMRSIADSWRKSAERRAASGRQEVRESSFLDPDAELLGDEEANLTPVDNAPSGEPDPEGAFLDHEDIRDVEAHFADDEVAGAVLHGMWAQRSGPEIREEWQLTEKQFAAAVRRIRRYGHRKGGSGGE